MAVKPSTKYAIVTLEVAIPVENVDPANLKEWCTDAVEEALSTTPLFDDWQVKSVWGPLGTPKGVPSRGDIFIAAGAFQDRDE